MENAWLDIPLDDYEGHMALPGVDQARLIEDLLADLIAAHRPESLAIIGCAGGNGFAPCQAAGIPRVVGLDINDRYVEVARRRFAQGFPGLELHVADLEMHREIFKPVAFLYAALVLEYVELRAAIDSFRRHCNPGGVLATLTQLPHSTLQAVSASPYTSLSKLGGIMRFVDARALVDQARESGFSLERETTLASSAGKQFNLHLFKLGGSR